MKLWNKVAILFIGPPGIRLWMVSTTTTDQFIDWFLLPSMTLLPILDRHILSAWKLKTDVRRNVFRPCGAPFVSVAGRTAGNTDFRRCIIDRSMADQSRDKSIIPWLIYAAGRRRTLSLREVKHTCNWCPRNEIWGRETRELPAGITALSFTVQIV